MNDEVLKYVVQKVEETDIGQGITLFLHGIIIEGNMINSRTYYDLLSDLNNNVEIITKDQVKIDKWNSYKDDFIEFIESMKNKENLDYIHLRDAVIKNPNERIPRVTTAWRGNISSIDGFSFGHGKFEITD